MLKGGADGDNVLVGKLGELIDLFKRSPNPNGNPRELAYVASTFFFLFVRAKDLPSLCQSPRDLQDQYTTPDTPSANLASFGAAYAHIIVDWEELGSDSRRAAFLSRHTKIQDITSVVVGQDQDARIRGYTINCSAANLFGRG